MHKILEKTLKITNAIILSIPFISSMQGMEVKDTSLQLIHQTSNLFFRLFQNNPSNGDLLKLVDQFQELKSAYQSDVRNFEYIAEMSYGFYTYHEPIMSQEDFEKEDKDPQLTYEDFCEQYQRQCDEIDIQDEIKSIEANIKASIKAKERRNKAKEKIDVSKKHLDDFCLEILKKHPNIENNLLVNHPYLDCRFKHIPEIWFFLNQIGEKSFIPRDIIIKIFQEVFKIEISKIKMSPPKQVILEQLLINKEDNQRVFYMDGLILEIPVKSNELLTNEKYALKNDESYIQGITLSAYPGNYCAKYILDRYRSGNVEILSFLSLNGKKLNLATGFTYKLSADKKYFSVHKAWQS